MSQARLSFTPVFRQYKYVPTPNQLTISSLEKREKSSPVFPMTLLDSDTLLCFIKLINCLMDHKSANTLMGPGVLC